MVKKQLLLLLSIFTIISCARISSPQGGPEDETPPVLTSSTPLNGQINFDESTITLSFNERIKTKNIETDLIITPTISGSFKTRISKKTITLSFQEPWEENTTYNLNFGATIQDITNNNSAENLSLSFSTGSYIDSLEISGTVKNLYSQEPIDNALVSLYRQSDTVDITNGKAPYFTRTDTSGNFTIRNLPSNIYKLYAAVDKNTNMKADTDEEAYGFYSTPITLDTTNATGLLFNLQYLNTKPLRLTSARPFGKYFDLTFNKSITNYKLQPIDTILTNHLPHYMKTEDTKIRFFNTNNNYTDTLTYTLTANDSINSNLTDTIRVYFNDSDVAKDQFQLNIEPTLTNVRPLTTFKVNFNKPVQQFIYDSIYFEKDTLTTLYIPDSSFQWNLEKTQLTWQQSVSQNLEEGESMKLIIKPNTFISVENDTSTLEEKRIQRYIIENTGKISGNIQTNAPHYIIQLVSDKTLEVIAQAYDQPQYEFSYLDAGTYRVRLIIDSNANRKWDTGNILTNEDPESIIYFRHAPSQNPAIELRKNWEINEIDITTTSVDN